MFQLRITDYETVAPLVASQWPTRIISVIMREMPAYGSHHVQILCDDIARPTPGMVLPTEAHLAQILDFTSDLAPTDRVLVHCSRGINRSPAVAMAICIQHGMDFTQAYRKVASLRPHLVPNRLLMSYVDRYFKLGGKLSGLAAARVSGYRGRPSSAFP